MSQLGTVPTCGKELILVLPPTLSGLCSWFSQIWGGLDPEKIREAFLAR